jgi:transposase, IS605 OrfB family, central region
LLSYIGVQDLNVKGMLKNHKLARAIADMGFYEFRRQLEYKANWRGGLVVIADRFFPSSKLCAGCGHKRENLALSIRKWVCDNCNATHDRDINAAINLKNCAVSSTVKSCGEESSGFGARIKVKLSSMKQESNTKLACI